MGLDYSVIPMCIKKTLESEGVPLTEEQYMLLSGSLGAAQLMIEQIGLDGAIDSLLPMAQGD